MNKICTDIEQSQKLIELGIDVGTADMYYWHGSHRLLRVNDGKCEDIDVPAWSLSALMNMLPKLYEFENDPEDGGCQPNLCKGWDNNQWHIVYRSSIYITEWYDDPLDAAFEMICWLKENKKL